MIFSKYFFWIDAIIEFSIASMYSLLGVPVMALSKDATIWLSIKNCDVISIPLSLIKYVLKHPLITKNSFVAISPSDNKVVPEGIYLTIILSNSFSK